MAEDKSRISFWWFALLAAAAVTAVLFLFIFALLDKTGLFWGLAVALGGAAALFGLAVLGFRLVKKTGRGAPKKPAARETAGDLEQRMKLGRQLLAEGRYQQAQQMFEEALRLDETNWQAYNYLGLTYSRQGLYEEAKAIYEKAVSLEFDYASAHFNLAIAHEKLGEHAQALTRWQRYLEVGEALGERADLLEHARARIAQLELELNREEPVEV